MRRVAVLAASARELAPVRAGLKAIRSGRLGSFAHEIGRSDAVEMHLLNTGIGFQAALVGAEAVLSAFTVDAVVSTGYVGALGSAGLGDVIVGTDVLDWTTEGARASFPCDSALLALARETAARALVGWSEGPVVTVANVVCKADQKQGLARASGAIAVDLESAAIARAAHVVGVPFLLVRAVSDRADEDLPMDFNLWLGPWGRVRGVAYLLRRPSIIRSLLRMRRHVEYGSQNLARFFAALVASLDRTWAPACPSPVAMGAR